MFSWAQQKADDVFVLLATSQRANNIFLASCIALSACSILFLAWLALNPIGEPTLYGRHYIQTEERPERAIVMEAYYQPF